eukprot:10624414-Karenia_brevis.AAC.1
MTHMLGNLSEEARKAGLELHPDKTKIMCNSFCKRRKSQQHVQIKDMKIEILSCDSLTKYLGRLLTFNCPHSTEINARIAFGWKKFFSLKQELLSKAYSLHDRLRLFQGTVTPTVLYGCTSWTLTVELEGRLRKAQRQMLRMIVKSPRKHQTQPNTTTSTHNNCTTTMAQTEHNSDDDTSDASSNNDNPNHTLEDMTAEETLEPWADWIRRCTHDAETRM